MPAETTTDERFARALDFERGAHTRAAARIEELRYGQALLQDDLPHVYWANMRWVAAGWERDAIVYMIHERAPDRLPDLAAVREVSQPRELYARLGFAPAGSIRGFLRPPPSEQGVANAPR